MRILFVLKRPAIAGVETLAIRLVNKFIERYGDEVGIVFFVKLRSDSFFRVLHPKCETYELLSPSSYAQLKKKNWDIIYSFETFGLLFSFWFWWRLKNRPKLCSGVYHPREYQWSPKKQSWMMSFATSLFRRIPEQNLIFMNESVHQRTADRLDSPLAQSSVIPLPINTDRLAQVVRTPKRGLIVSVGRLTDFKTYNEHMIITVAEMVRKGYDIHYRIYGDGELRGKLSRLANKLNVADRVRFEGEIAYDKMPEVFATAHCFVGCGTASVEAAAAGVPSLVAIEAAREPICFGFFPEGKGYNLGEVDRTRPHYTYFGKLQWLLEQENATYEVLSQQHKVRAAEFAADKVVDRYREVLQNAAPTPQIQLKTPELVRWIFTYFTLKIFARLGFKNILSGRYLEVN